jgi:hypothetical protein
MKETAIEQCEETDCYGSAEKPSLILLPMSCQVLLHRLLLLGGRRLKASCR